MLLEREAEHLFQYNPVGYHSKPLTHLKSHVTQFKDLFLQFLTYSYPLETQN